MIKLTLEQAKSILEKAGIKARINNDAVEYGDSPLCNGYVSYLSMPGLRSVTATASTEEEAENQLIEFVKEATIIKDIRDPQAFDDETLKNNTQEIIDGGMYSFNTIIDFGLASHIDGSRGGLIIHLKEAAGQDGRTVIMNQNESKTGFEFAYDYDFSEEQRTEVNDLLKWITE